MVFSARIQEDLATSGLSPEDMKIRELDPSTRAATTTPFSAEGYAIPYFDMRGAPLSFYRVKLFDHEPKYKQPSSTPAHVYFPPGFLALAKKHNYVVLTEGEKKAAAACKLGIPTCALGGADAWRNRSIIIPKETEINATDKSIRAKLPSGQEVREENLTNLATGIQDLIDFCIGHDKHLVIIFDNDRKSETSFNVQRAAASLGYELRFRGLGYNRIRQIRLPMREEDDKMGLDDYLCLVPLDTWQKLLQTCLAKRIAFPRHPNVRDFLNKRLQNARMSRREMQQAAMAVLCELDANGIRLRSKTELQTYYFDQNTHKLLQATFTDNPALLTDSAFGHYLYRHFGIGAADARLIQWIGTQFTGEDPVEEVNPFRVMARPKETGGVKGDAVLYQISDGQYVEVRGDTDFGDKDTPGLAIHNNGEDGILFVAEQVKALNTDLLRAEYIKQYKPQDTPIPFWWGDVLNQVRLKDKNKGRVVAALLYYISPWLYRWRGTQLPIEMTLGEAGSGKSTLQELRLQINTGIPKLRNAPSDMKDWAASVTKTGGTHIIDNLALPDKNMRQKLSDEMCRIVTEPDPSIDMRKYYTNADLVQLPVRCVFGITAIKQPFLNSDVMARAMILELDKAQDMVNGSLSYDSQWMQTQLQRFGGREAWVAHHLHVLHHFFAKVRERWSLKYSAKHRLINFEQSLVLMAEIFGLKGDWIPGYLQGVTAQAVLDTDWAFEGLVNFAAQRREAGRVGPQSRFGIQEISNWALSMEEYEKCEELTNSRRLARYVMAQKSLLMSSIGLTEGGTQNNRKLYYLDTR